MAEQEPGTEGGTPDPDESAWTAQQAAVFEGDAEAAEQRAAGERHNERRIEAGDEAAFEQNVALDLTSGALAPPPGGPVTPEEEAWALEHPWPGHSNRETIERERAARAAAAAGQVPDPPPGFTETS